MAYIICSRVHRAGPIFGKQVFNFASFTSKGEYLPLIYCIFLNFRESFIT